MVGFVVTSKVMMPSACGITLDLIVGSDCHLIFEGDLLDCRFIEEGELVKKEAKMIKKVQEKDSAVCHSLPFWNRHTAHSLTQCTYRAFAELHTT